MKHSVAIVGFAKESLAGAYTCQVDEIWTLNHAGFLLAQPYLDFPALPHIDRVFDIHKLDFIFDPAQYSKEYWEYLVTPHDYPIYMQERDPRIPASVKYPLEEVCEDLFHRFYRGDDMNIYLTSTLPFMIGLAIHEGFKRIELYGVEMGTQTEYRYQKPGGEFLIGVAVGRGIEVVLPETTQLCRGLLYGYEAIHMITRQRLEAWRRSYQKELSSQLADTNILSGKLNEMKTKVNESAPEYQALEKEVVKAHEMVFAYNGAIQAVEKLMLECDMVPEGAELQLRVEAREIVNA